MWVTIPVWRKGLGLQNINRVEICNQGNWPKKRLKSLKAAYSNAPYLDEHIGILEEIFSGIYRRLVDLNIRLTRYVFRYLELDTEMVLQSELGIHFRGNQLLVDICKKAGADRFLAQSPTKSYLDARMFAEENICLEFTRLPSPVYPQLWGEFIPNLSVFDLLLNCGPKSREIIFGH